MVARKDDVRSRPAGNLGPDFRQSFGMAGGRARRGPSAALKHGRFETETVDARELVARGVVDPLFPRYLKESGVRAWLAGPTDGQKIAEGLRRPIFPEIVGRPEKDCRQSNDQTPNAALGMGAHRVRSFPEGKPGTDPRLEHVDLFLSKAGSEVLRMYKQDLDLPPSVRIYRDTSASSVTVGQFCSGIYHTLIVAPATSNAVAKFVYGISDDFISNIFAQAGKCRIPTLVFACDTAPELETEAPRGMVKVYPRPIDLENRERLGAFCRGNDGQLDRRARRNNRPATKQSPA